MLRKMFMSCFTVVAFATPGFAVDTRLIERGMEDLSYARSQLRRLIEENSRNNNSPLMDRLAVIEDLLGQSHQNIASGLYGDRPDEPGRISDYKFFCKSSVVPNATGKGWTRIEARAGAAQLCKKEKHSTFCDDDSEFTCESVPDAYPLHSLNYSKVCHSNNVPGAIGFGWTIIEARAIAAKDCTLEKHSNYCDDESEFTCETVNSAFLRNTPMPYRFACLSNNVPGAIGKGLTKTEAIAEAATMCRGTKHVSYCDDDSEFTCEASK